MSCLAGTARTVDHGVDTLLESLHGGEGLEGLAKQNHGGVVGVAPWACVAMTAT